MTMSSTTEDIAVTLFLNREQNLRKLQHTGASQRRPSADHCRTFGMHETNFDQPTRRALNGRLNSPQSMDIDADFLQGTDDFISGVCPLP